MSGVELHVLFYLAGVMVIKELNTIVDEPYMDEPFHVPQAQAYCRGEFSYWDPKITTPPGLYLLSLVLNRIFLFKCNLAMLRLTPFLCLSALPVILTRLLRVFKRERPPASLLTTDLDAIILSAHPIAWFFGFLYYTEVPSLLLVSWCVSSAMNGQHYLAALLGALSCAFRQTNIVWVVYAYGASQLAYLRFRRVPPGAKSLPELHDPPALEASPFDLIQSITTFPQVVKDILPSFIPYSVVLALFGVFVFWNGGIVLGDKSNHIPAFHVPQIYYFIGFMTGIGWPILLSVDGGALQLTRDVVKRMFGSKTRSATTVAIIFAMCITIKYFTIQHPFLLSDNRHFAFYIWRRVFLVHPLAPYLLTPAYLACAWAWFIRLGKHQSLLQTLCLPVLTTFTLLPTPLLEPRYFLIPYILLRAQIPDVPAWALLLEGAWYAAIDASTMSMFLYYPRPGVGRFMCSLSAHFYALGESAFGSLQGQLILSDNSDIRIQSVSGRGRKIA